MPASFARPARSGKIKALKKVRAGKFEVPKLKNSGQFNPSKTGTIQPQTPQPGGKPGVGQVNVPPPPPPPAPDPGLVPQPTLRGEQTRQNANTKFGTAKAGLAQDLFDAAFRYGDPNALSPEMRAAFGIDAAVGDNPIGELATIGRQRVEQGQNLDEDLNQGNTFFSGIRLRKQGDLDNQAEFARQDAHNRFTSAYNKLVSLLAQATDERNAGLGEADLMDIEGAQAVPPEPEGPLPPQGQMIGANPPTGPNTIGGPGSIRPGTFRTEGKMVGVPNKPKKSSKKPGSIKQVKNNKLSKKKKGKK